MTEVPLPVSELKTALIGLNKIISRQTTLPVLGCIKVERSSAGAITLAANNLDQAAVVSLDSDGQGEACTILVPLKDLSLVVKRCSKGDTIAVQTEDNASGLSGMLKYPVGSSTAEHRFDLIPVEEFPPIPQIDGNPVPVPDALRSSLLEAFQCASDDETRYILNGAYLDVSEPKCHQIAATNGRILYASNSFTLPLKQSVIIPTSKFLQWKPFVYDGAWTMTLGQEEDGKPAPFQISSLRWRFISKQIEGNYPNYRQVIPAASAFERKIVFDPATLPQLIQTIERMPCHDPVHHTIGLQIKNRSVFVLGKSTGDQPWSSFQIEDVKATGKDVLAAFDREYVARALRFGLNTMQIVDEITPARFSDGGRQMIVMPVRPDCGPAHQQQKPAESSPEEEAPTTERNEHMRNQSTAAPAAATNGNGNGHTPEAETAPTITDALQQIETIKGSYRQAVQGLNQLAETLKQVQRDQKASEKEVQSVRTTLEKLQSVRL